MPTVKPLDAALAKKAAEHTNCLVVCEEQSIIGGLGAATAEAISEQPVPLLRIGVNDIFGESGGAQELMVKYGLTADNIAAQVKAAIKLKHLA